MVRTYTSTFPFTIVSMSLTITSLSGIVYIFWLFFSESIGSNLKKKQKQFLYFLSITIGNKKKDNRVFVNQAFNISFSWNFFAFKHRGSVKSKKGKSKIALFLRYISWKVYSPFKASNWLNFHFPFEFWCWCLCLAGPFVNDMIPNYFREKKFQL